MLEIRNLRAGYGDRPVLNNISLTVPAGRITVIAGPNGCGKSTLLKAIVGSVPPTEGKILLNGRQLLGLPPRLMARQIAYLPQSRQVPDITAERLVLHGRFPYLRYPRRYRQADLDIARQAMKSMGIGDLRDRLMPTLSGGQRQKVYIAMALAQDTPVVLMDEPTTFLDIAHQIQVMEEAKTLAAKGKTVVMVLHDLSMALRQADHIAVMGQGTVLAQGDPETVWRSGCLETAFGIGIQRIDTPDGWQYYYKESGC